MLSWGEMTKHAYPLAAAETAVEITKSGAVSLRVKEVDAATSVLELAVDYEKAEVPARAYASDFCKIIKTQIEYVIVFGKLAPGTLKLRNKVEIAFQRHAFGHQLWNSTRPLETALREHYGTEAISISSFEDTDVVQSFRSNNAFMAGLGDEGLVDFYYIPPNEIEYVRRGRRQKVTLDPVLRIVMSAPLLLYFIEQIDATVKAEPGWEAIIKADLEKYRQ
jgi:hypothetical protein